MSDPGSIIALVTIAYTGAAKAWSALQKASHYPEDSADLVVRLGIERFRFENWAKNSGLTKGTFDPALHPVYHLVADRLRRIEKLFEDGDQFQDLFGLSISEATKTRTNKAKGIMAGMALSMRAVGLKIDLHEKEPTNALKQLRWGLTSKAKFEKLVLALETQTNKLNALLTETQMASASNDWNRVNIVVVGSLEDENSLNLISQAVHQNGPSTSLNRIETLMEKKAITMPNNIRYGSKTRALEIRNLRDYEIPFDHSSRNRFFSHALPEKASTDEGVLLFEKKSYDKHISFEDRQILKSRLERLVVLLNSPKSQSFRVFAAKGYCHDPESLCWWMIFQVPLKSEAPIKLPGISLASAQPISLNSILTPKLKPPLERRYELGYQISETLADLFTSSWMHKEIRSDNILFPYMNPSSSKEFFERFNDISKPFLAGFQYSRLDSEAATIDKAKHLDDVRLSLYRHPNYQGVAASGYKPYYDFYSFGMVLVEIALWSPLASFLDPVGSQPTVAVHLSSKMKYFHKAEALELQKRVLAYSDTQMPFKVGSRYCEVVKWCLTCSEPQGQEDWHPALEFYNHVVLPLEKYAMAFKVNDGAANAAEAVV